MRTIRSSYLIGKVIESIEFENKKYRIIFKLKGGLEISTYIDTYEKYNQDNVMTKNRKNINCSTIKNIQIKDIGWCAYYSIGVNSFFIVDTDANVYRMPCQSCNYGAIMYLYNHTQYKLEKAERKKKINERKAKLKKLFSPKKSKYDIVS